MPSLNVAIPNIKKELVVEFSKAEIENKLPYLCKTSQYYKSCDLSNKLIGQYEYNFHKPISGLIDVGIKAVINLEEITKTKTKITIEIIDGWEGTNDGYDVDSANIIIKEVCNSLNNILTNDIDVLTQQKQEEHHSYNWIWWILLGIFLLWLFI